MADNATKAENAQAFGNPSAEHRSLADDLDQLKLDNENTNSKVVEFKEGIERSKETKSSGSDIPDLDIESDSNDIQQLDDLGKAPSELSITGFRSCKRPECEICPHAKFGQHFKSSVDGKMYPIEDSMSCTSNNVLYLITCVQCNMQYVGQTGQTLYKRFEEHMKKSSKLKVDKHFKEKENHSWDDMDVIAIEQILDKGKRLKKESYWISVLKTMEQDGLNEREK